MTIVATAFTDNSTDTNWPFDKLLKGPALIEAMASPGVDGLVDRLAFICSSSKNSRDCVEGAALFVEADMMPIVERYLSDSAGTVVADNSRTDNKLYINNMGVQDTVATSSHAGDLSQAVAPLFPQGTLMAIFQLL